MKKLFVMSLFVMALCASSALAQKQSVAGSAEVRTGESKSTPHQAVSDRTSKPASSDAKSSAGSAGNQSTGARTTTTGAPNVTLPSTQNATRTGQQSSAPPQAVNGNTRKP